MLAVPIQAVVVREVDKEGKVVDPDAARRRPRDATAQDARRAAKGEEKEGVFVVASGRGARSGR